MSIFSRSKEKEELVLVFNIGSSSVGATLFKAHKSGVPKIIFSIREPILLEKEVKVDRLFSLMTQSLEFVVNAVYRAKLGAPAKVFCVLSSPWYVSQTRTINLKQGTPFVFSEKLAESLTQKEVKIFEEENDAKWGKASSTMRIIELKNIKTILNGYETHAPINQKAEQLEMIIFISIGSEQVLTKIESVIKKHFHGSPIRFSSFALASFTIIRDLKAEEEDFLLVEIGGEVTDISLVKKNVLRESISFPLGRNFLTRGVSESLSSTFGEANSLISLFKHGHAEGDVAENLGKVLGELKAKWLKEFQNCIANISNDISIPALIYLAADKEVADFFSETIKTEQFSQYTLTESKFQITVVDTKLLYGIAELGENVEPVPNLLVDAMYVNRFLI